MQQNSCRIGYSHHQSLKKFVTDRINHNNLNISLKSPALKKKINKLALLSLSDKIMWKIKNHLHKD
jgi:hypothetical protein